MVDQVEFLWSLISLFLHLFQVLRKASSMALCSNSSTHGPLTPWKRLAEALASPHKRPKEGDDRRAQAMEVVSSKTSILTLGELQQENVPVSNPRSLPLLVSTLEGVQCVECVESTKAICVLDEECVQESFERKEIQMLVSDSTPKGKPMMLRKLSKRPSRLAIPELCALPSFKVVVEEKETVEKELEVEGSDYCLASRKGSRHEMEDGYGVITNINGDSKQAFFGVFDGHGGRAAVDFVSENLGKNIIAVLSDVEEEGQGELAISTGYLTTDREFLDQGVSSGACAATVLLKNGELIVSNVGDCRVVMSTKGVATTLTCDQLAGREDERIRIENLGGYVTCNNGIWRVQDTLAVSRSIGDMNMKEWITSEPETKKLRLTPDCEFLILATDGMWNKVSDQEAVDVVSRRKNWMESCKELVNISSRRGSRDDITVMVVDLRRYMHGVKGLESYL